MKERAGYNMIQPGASSRTHHISGFEARGRKYKMTSEQVWEADHLLQDDDLGLEAKALPWEAVAAEVEAEVTEQTIRKTMNVALGYGKRLACVKGHQSEHAKAKRMEWASFMLAKYPLKEDWRHIRFSDEIHFGYGPEDQLRIIRKPGTRYRHDNLQHRLPPPKEDKNRLRKHCWAAVGYNFKSDMIFYDVPTNKNGKMTHQVYINSILEPVVKPWLEAGDEFVLEEDGDSGHGTGRANPVRKWKEDHGLKSYFNCAQSPDLSPIENCWLIPKSHVHKYHHWDDSTLEELIHEGWAHVSQEFINSKVDEMPDRLQAVLDCHGDMTGY